MPKFIQIATGEDGVLYALDTEGQVWTYIRNIENGHSKNYWVKESSKRAD